MNLQVGIFAALLVVEFFAISIDRKLGRIIYLLKEIKNKEAQQWMLGGSWLI